MAISRKIEEIFNQWKSKEVFSGVISVSNKEGVIYEKVQGFRNKGEQLPNQTDTAFGIASGTKLFTAAAILQLIDQGKLTLDTKIADILPQDLKTINKDITVFHLLTHSSGIADYLDFDDDDIEAQFYDAHPVNKWTSNEYYLPLFNELPSKFELGEKADYSNSNFILLGLIIEAIAGESYHDYVRKNILEPLNMKRTGFYETNDLPANAAVGYMWNDDLKKYVGNYFRLPVIGVADGGLYTTAEDMKLFWLGLFECKLFSKNMLEQFLTPRTVFDDIGGHFGLCVFVTEKDGETIYWHDGGDCGVGFHSAYFPTTGNILTVLSNRGTNLLAFSDDLMQAIVAKNE